MLPTRMTMFCIVSLRCFPEGPFPPTRPGQDRRETPALAPLAAARPPRPGVVRAGASAPTRSGAAGVAGGNRTGLGDQSVGGIGAFRKPGDDAQPNHRPCRQQRPIRPQPPSRGRTQPNAVANSSGIHAGQAERNGNDRYRISVIWHRYRLIGRGASRPKLRTGYDEGG